MEALQDAGLLRKDALLSGELSAAFGVGESNNDEPGSE